MTGEREFTEDEQAMLIELKDNVDQLDTAINVFLQSLPSSRERSATITQFDIAFMWLRKTVSELKPK